MKLLALTVLLALAVYVFLRVRFWFKQGALMQTSGHRPPSPSIWARAFLAVFTRLLVYLGIGPVKVRGRKNLKNHGRKIYVPNHTFQFDFAMVAKATRSSFRFMTKTSELRGARGVFGAWTGAIPVNTDVQGGGEAAVRASVEAVAEEGDHLLIFPQGKLVQDNILRREDFKTGFARISHAAHEETCCDQLYIVPVALYYERDRAKAPFSHHILKPLRKLFGPTNYGGAVVIGEEIPIEQLPADPAAATDLIFGKLEKLLEEARRL